ncbi:BREX-1 system phosphatase PglZ type A [Romboutsia ilealis]|nr:BREX-1 system phosphatase PglZ type A [Romboutsia ilealis]
MNLEEVIRVLNDIYKEPLLHEKKRHIVFWYDADGEFVEDIDTLELNNVRVLKLNENNYFYIRYELEKVDTDSNILIYANMEKPNPRENWLLDIYKYSTEFSTDKTTVMMRDLNIKDASLRNVLKDYSKFFNNKERYASFKKYNIEEYTEDLVHIAVLSSLCKLSNPNFEEVTKVILKEALTEDKKQIENIEKFGKMEAFWELASRKYGYNLEDKTPGKLMILLALTDLSDKVDKELPNNYKTYISNKKSDCTVFINHFMNDREYSTYYNDLADKVQEVINLDKTISKWDIDDFIECDTFRYFDEYIIKKLVDIIKSEASEFDKYLSIIHNRKSLYWYKEYKHYYDALEYAIELFRIKDEIENIKQRKPIDMIESYYKDERNSYYLIDKAYRKFYIAYDKVKDPDILYTLMEQVESIYTNWYLDELAVKWSSSIKDELGTSWRMGGILPQRMFYSSFVEPHIAKNEKVFVVISDALRYDCAKELTDILNMERKGIATIDALQGVLPSYTKLGMASLLPNRFISLDDKNNVYVDGINASGTENRDKILKSKNPDSIAVAYNDIKDISSTEFRNMFSGKKVIYIYHNVIDARGDNASTEREVFDAVEDAFVELNQLVGHIVSRANGSNIYITSDHGFLYRRGNLDATHKIKYDSDESYGRRYAITDSYEEQPGILTFSMDYILGNDSNKYVTVPRGEVRFAKQGAGSNYVHGGAMPQEIIIPVIKFKNSRGVGKVDEKVEIEMTTISRKITTPRFTINFLQKDKVEDKKLPLMLKAYFEDSNGEIISNENSIFGDSKSSNTEDRIYKERFTLKSISYDKNAKYYLVLVEDNEVKNEYARYEFIIDIAIQDEFGF